MAPDRDLSFYAKYKGSKEKLLFKSSGYIRYPVKGLFHLYTIIQTSLNVSKEDLMKIEKHFLVISPGLIKKG